MSTGELESKQAFEENTTKNVKTMIDYSKETRVGLRETQARVIALEAEIYSQKAIIEEFKIQLAGVQTKLFSGGT